MKNVGAHFATRVPANYCPPGRVGIFRYPFFLSAGNHFYKCYLCHNEPIPSRSKLCDLSLMFQAMKRSYSRARNAMRYSRITIQILMHINWYAGSSGNFMDQRNETRKKSIFIPAQHWKYNDSTVCVINHLFPFAFLCHFLNLFFAISHEIKAAESLILLYQGCSPMAGNSIWGYVQMRKALL